MRQEWVGKRHTVRTSVQLRAQMRFGNDRPPVDCVVSDISLTGARVLLADSGSYPDGFEIFIPARSEAKWAKVRWRDKKQLGVEFVKDGREDRDSAAEPLAARLEAIEERVAALAAAPPARSGAIVAEPPPEAAWGPDEASALQALGVRLAKLEARLEESESGLRQRGASLDRLEPRLDELAAKIEAVEARSAETAQTPAESEGFAARLGALEGNVGELRASLRTLILLLSAQISRAKSESQSAG